MWRDRFGSSRNVAEIGFVVFIEWRRDANDDRIHAYQLRVIGGRRKPLLAATLDLGRGDAKDIRATCVERGDFSLIDIESSHGEPLVTIEKCQRKSDVPQS